MRPSTNLEPFRLPVNFQDARLPSTCHLQGSGVLVCTLRRDRPPAEGGGQGPDREIYGPPSLRVYTPRQAREPKQRRSQLCLVRMAFLDTVSARQPSQLQRVVGPLDVVVRPA